MCRSPTGILFGNLLKIVWCISTADWTSTVVLKPLIHTFCMKFMSTWKHSDYLPRLEVTHTDNAHGLIILIAVRGLGSITIRWKLLNIGLWKPFWFDLSQALRQAEQGLVVFSFVHIVRCQLRVQRRVGQHGQDVEKEGGISLPQLVRSCR